MPHAHFLIIFTKFILKTVC